MAIKRNNNMVDVLGNPVYEGDIIFVVTNYDADIYIHLIKHFSNNGIYGPILKGYNDTIDDVPKNVKKKVDGGVIHCYSTYCARPWGDKWDFSNRIIKANLNDLPITQEQYITLLEMLGLQAPELTEHKIKITG